jgi:hypothetical protein
MTCLEQRGGFAIAFMAASLPNIRGMSLPAAYLSKKLTQPLPIKGGAVQRCCELRAGPPAGPSESLGAIYP